MKVLIIGNSKAGKTTAAEMVAEMLGTKSANTSDYIINEFCRANFIPLDEVRNDKDKYRAQLWEYGRKHQALNPLWAVRGAMELDAAGVVTSIEEMQQFLAQPRIRVLTGVRNRDELAACRQARMFDIVIWVDREGTTPNGTDGLHPTDADFIVPNNGTLEELQTTLQQVLQVQGERTALAAAECKELSLLDDQ